MMDVNNFQGMMGGATWGVASFMWLTYLLFIALLVLGIAALWKYISKG